MSFLEKYFKIIDENIKNSSNIIINDRWESQKIEYRNFLVEQPIVIGNGSINDDSYYPPTEWINAIKQMGKWYAENIDTYQGGVDNKHAKGKHYYDCKLINGKVADDCSGFVSACLKYFNINAGELCTMNMQPGTKFDSLLKSKGFKYVPYNRSDLRAGDIMVTNGRGHTSICGGIINGVQKFYDWGNNRNVSRGGLPCGFIPSAYAHVWRYIS